MKKAEKVRKTVTRISAGVIFVCLLILTLQINIQGDDGNSPFKLSALTFGIYTQSAYATITPGRTPCWGGYHKKKDYTMTYCTGCVKKKGYEGDGMQVMCE